MEGLLNTIATSFTKQGGYKGELGVVGAVAVAGAGYLAYEEWLKHHNKEHSEEAAAEFQSQVQPGYESHPDFVANYGPGGKHHKKHHWE
ncbi:hypothetical protein HDU79_011243 [Rhizoclosmatium sp. JEL0117]|nr:hypothetical protein HDU79_011243 [Rhizoclosmatium sp. JEL0117]